VMTGQFAWTYRAGDFANGTGTVTELIVPYSGKGIGALTLVLDNTSLTGTLPGNFHGQGVDFGLTFTPALASPTQSVSVATSSSFDIWDYSGRERLGTVTTGQIVPYQPPLAFQKAGTNVFLSWPTNYTDAFVLETASSLAVGIQWQTSSAPRVVIGPNYVVTNSIVSGRSAFYRLAQ